MTTALHPRGRLTGVASRGFYHLDGGLLSGLPCTGTACLAAGADLPDETERVYCLGRCYQAPAVVGDPDLGPSVVEIVSTESVVLEGVASSPGGRISIDAYRAGGGYLALSQVLDRDPAAVIDEVVASRIRGRGGAGFPAGQKWAAVRSHDAPERFVIANADEGDPGAYIDRFIIERDPHLVIEALAIAALAVGASRAYIYLRAEYADAARVFRHAMNEASEASVLGESVLGLDRAFDIELVMGEGSYLCGEETAMIRSIEGRRPEPWARPPYPTEAGLFGMPTLVNNVETLASIPWIIRHGGEAYAALGTEESTGTKVVSLNSLFTRPGLYEVDLGTSLRTIVEDLGGGLAKGELLGVMVGGPLAGVVPPEFLDTPLSFEAMREIGCAVGHGGIVAFSTDTSIAALIENVAAFAAYESCGKCTPCRTEPGRISAVAGGRAERVDCDGAVQALRQTSLCGHGSGFGEFMAAVKRHFPEEVEACLG